METLIELKFINSSFSSLSSYQNQTNSSLSSNSRQFEATVSQSSAPSPPLTHGSRVQRGFCSSTDLHSISLVRAPEETFRTGVFDALEGTRDGCLLGEPICRRPVRCPRAPPARALAPRWSSCRARTWDIYIYIYIYIYIFIWVCIYIYIYICRERERL